MVTILPCAQFFNNQPIQTNLTQNVNQGTENQANDLGVFKNQLTNQAITDTGISSSSSFFQKNVNDLFGSETDYYYFFNNYIILFQNSSIICNYEKYVIPNNGSIKFLLRNSNNVKPIGLKSRNISETYYNGNQKYTNFEFSELKYSEIYNNIDLEFYISNNGLKYNFIVHPGGNPNEIVFDAITPFTMSFSSTNINFIQQKTQQLIFSDSNPISFQKGSSKINTSFTKVIDRVCTTCYAFRVGPYNVQADLTIDPFWIMNETNIQMQNSNVIQANGLQMDSQGNIFVLGQDILTSNFSNIFVTKYSSSGEYISQTLIGGDHIEIGAQGELGRSIIIDSFDNIYITGYRTNKTSGGKDAILVKLSNNLILLTQITFGGSKDDEGRSITIFNNEIFIAGETDSSDLPLKNPLEVKYNGGSNDIFIAKFDFNLKLLYLTYLGGSADDEVHAIATDAVGNLVLTGLTTSADFNQTKNSLQSSIGSINNPDAFIVKISNNGKILIFSSFFGGIQMDEGNGIAFDSSNNMYIIGDSESSQLPFKDGSTPILFIGVTTSLSKVFILGLNEDGFQLPRYYIFDGDSYDYGTRLKIEQNGNIILAGNSYSSNFWNYNSSSSVFSTGSLNSRSFITEINSKGGITGINSKINENCTGITCVQLAQDFLINKDNVTYLLGNNRVLKKNSTEYNWIPFLIKISNSADTTKPQILIKNYKPDKVFKPNSTITLEIMDDLSGIKEVEYKWDNGTYSKINYPYTIQLPATIGDSYLYITAIDNAGNSITTNPFTFIINTQNYNNIMLIIGSIALSIVFAYLTIHMFWKYYYSKKRLTRQLQENDVKDYIKLVSQDLTLLDEINETKK